MESDATLPMLAYEIQNTWIHTLTCTVHSKDHCCRWASRLVKPISILCPPTIRILSLASVLFVTVLTVTVTVEYLFPRKNTNPTQDDHISGNNSSIYHTAQSIQIWYSLKLATCLFYTLSPCRLLGPCSLPQLHQQNLTGAGRTPPPPWVVRRVQTAPAVSAQRHFQHSPSQDMCMYLPVQNMNYTS